MSIQDFIGKATYDEAGQMIWGNNKDGEQLILNVRGWGKIQYMFKTLEEAMKFQDDMGRFITEAINEKLENDTTKTKS